MLDLTFLSLFLTSVTNIHNSWSTEQFGLQYFGRLIRYLKKLQNEGVTGRSCQHVSYLELRNF
jgi:hypothetical protein